MDHRLGICTTCKARYQIPVSFQHPRARCRSCGGVVEIGPVPSRVQARVDRSVPAPTRAPMPPAPPSPAASPPPERAASARERQRPDSVRAAAPEREQPRRERAPSVPAKTDARLKRRVLAGWIAGAVVAVAALAAGIYFLQRKDQGSAEAARDGLDAQPLAPPTADASQPDSSAPSDSPRAPEATPEQGDL